MTVDEPYFMKNDKWYYHDEKEFRYKLTPEAPLRARQSYKAFYALLLEAYDMESTIKMIKNQSKEKFKKEN